VGTARLKSDSVREMRRLAADGMSQRAIARRFGVSKNAVTSVVSRRTWAHVL
jgi:transposase